MKKLLLCMCLILSQALYAKNVLIEVGNESQQTITVVREDGSNFTVPPHEVIEDIKFKTGTKVSNFINGKWVCDWQVDEETDGLWYRKTSYGEWECNNAYSV